MTPEISERSFEEAIEYAPLQHGPDPCVGDATAVRETPPSYGETPPGGYRRRKAGKYGSGKNFTIAWFAQQLQHPTRRWRPARLRLDRGKGSEVLR